ncbi:MAG: Rieske (2Fe-2S) protein [Candidatus Sumerlaeota bacterium]|nr:Rieske (2Fe-2S) protein [Candidatus Sumerlaeota bacterium]
MSVPNDRSVPGEAPTDPPSSVRRRILDVLLGVSFFTWLGSVVYPVVRYLLPPEGPALEQRTIRVGEVKDFKKNSGTLFRMGAKPGILICTPSGELRAFLAVCTHLQCTVQYKPDEGVIWCACHNGRYNLQGINISGPPPRPLTPLQVKLKGNEVYVSLA